MSTAANRYDTVAYPTFAQPQTHPDRLATIATLFGMTPAPVQRCRVLEVGCGTGENLIPMAYTAPESEFVGIDLAARPVQQGEAAIAELGLPNVRLLCADLTSLTPEFGLFDYVIAHGVYAWVPPFVQEGLLRLCRQNLSTNGVAFISYNTYPGARIREMLRTMMLFHTASFDDPRERVQQAKSLLAFLAASQDEGDPYRALLHREAEQIAKRQDGALFHDELSDCYLPVLFSDFIQRAGQAGLQYLGEADFFEMNENVLASSADLLRELGQEDLTRKEQYMDFLKCRKFRQTLLCQGEVPLRREIEPDALQSLWASALAFPVADSPREFRTAKGATIVTEHPAMRAVLEHLARVYPRPVPFAEMVTLTESPEQLRDLLVRLYGSALIEMQSAPPRFIAEVSERPRASRLARWQVQRQEVVASLRHGDVRVSGALSQRLLTLLDGSRTQGDLLAELRRIDPAVSEGALSQNLAMLSRLALLEA
jgi:methyltransferase-like protein/trans-aconitate methyltransferase